MMRLVAVMACLISAFQCLWWAEESGSLGWWHLGALVWIVNATIIALEGTG